MEFLESIENVYNIVPEIVFQIISYLGTAAAMLFLYFSSRYQNRELKAKWYILAFFFPFITSMVYLSKSKEYNKKAGMKVCPCCGDLYPASFQICSRCLVELPEFDEVKSEKNKKLSKIFLYVFIGLFVVDLAMGSLAFGASIKDIFSGINEISESVDEFPERIPFEDSDGALIYYDRNGEANYDNLDFPLYDKEGNLYYFVIDTKGVGFYKEDDEDEWNDANFFLNEYCFVDEDGYFVYLDDEEPVRIEEEGREFNYYFDAPYTNGKGDLYYPAISASWNEKGELITSAEQLDD